MGVFQSPLYNNETIIIPIDYPTIQQGINHAQNGDTIYIQSGEYSENIIVNKSVQINGENKNSVNIKGLNPSDHVFFINANHVHISNVSISNCSKGFSGIRIQGDHCEIKENIIVSC